MKCEFNERSKDFVVIDSERLKKIHDLIQSRVGPVQIQSDCSDSITRNFDSIKKFCNYENPINKEIISVRFRAMSDNYEKTCTFSINNNKYSPETLIFIEAREDVTTRLKEDLITIVSPCKRWYSGFREIHFGLTSFLPCFLSAMYSIAHFMSFLKENKLSQSHIPLDFYLIFVYCISIFVISCVLENFNKKYICKNYFLIGQGELRYLKIFNKIKISLGILFTIFLGLIGEYLYDLLSG